jgi:hypothetical protein
MSEQPPRDDDAILANMLREAESLCLSQDALLCGQYRHLQDRIRALIELRECFQIKAGG